MYLASLAPLAAETVRTESRLNLRQEPTTASLRVALLLPGSDLEVISRRGLWLRVKSSAGEGWVHSDYVVSADSLVPAAPARSLQEAELARDVALLRVEQLERELAGLGLSSPVDVGELRAQLAERDRRVAELVEEIATVSGRESADTALQAELEVVSSERDRLSREVGEAQQRLEAANDALAAASEDSAPKEMEALADELSATVDERDRVSARASQLQNELDAARQSLTAARETQTRRDGEMKAELGGLTAGVERLENDLSSARQAMSQEAERVAALERRVVEGEAAAQGAASRAAELETTIATLRRELASRTVGRSELGRQLAAAQLSLEGREAEIEALEEQRAEETEGVVAEREEWSSSLQAAQSESGRLNRRLSDLEATLRQRDEQVAVLEQAASTPDEAEDLRSRLTAMGRTKSDLEVQRTVLREDLAAAEAELELNVAQAKVFESEAQRLATALKELQEWSVEAERAVERLSADKSELEGHVAVLKQRRSRHTEPVLRELEVALSRALAAERSAKELELALDAARGQLVDSRAAAQEQLDEQLADSRAKRTAAEEALETVRSALEGERSTAAEATTQAELLRTQLAQIEQRERSSATARGVALRELDASATRSEAQRGEIARLLDVEKRLREQVTALEMGATQAEGQRLEIARLSEVEEQLGARVRELEGSATETAAWQRRAETAVRELASSRREAASLRAELESDRARVAASRRPVASSGPIAESATEDGRATAAIEAVRQWAAAWSSQDVVAYLAFYDEGFEPANGVERGAWEARRRQRISGPTFVEVKLRNLELRGSEAGRAVVSFDQSYRSDSFSDRVRKSLEMVKRGGVWKIIRETSP